MTGITHVEVDGVVVAATRKIDLTAEPATCKGSGRLVSTERQKRAVYTTVWKTWCPHCLKPAPFGLAEAKEGGGYRRRYLAHPPAQVEEDE